MVNQLVALELRLTIQDRVEKALLLLTEAMKEGKGISDDTYAKLMEARDQLHSATVLCKLQSERTPSVEVIETDEKNAA